MSGSTTAWFFSVTQVDPIPLLYTHSFSNLIHTLSLVRLWHTNSLYAIIQLNYIISGAIEPDSLVATGLTRGIKILSSPALTLGFVLLTLRRMTNFWIRANRRGWPTLPDFLHIKIHHHHPSRQRRPCTAQQMRERERECVSSETLLCSVLF